MAVNQHMPNIGPRLSIYTHEGELVARLGSKEGVGSEPGRFMSPHGLAVDSRGDIYVGEVSYTNWPSSHGDQPMPDYLRTLQKFEKIALRMPTMSGLQFGMTKPSCAAPSTHS